MRTEVKIGIGVGVLLAAVVVVYVVVAAMRTKGTSDDPNAQLVHSGNRDGDIEFDNTPVNSPVNAPAVNADNFPDLGNTANAPGNNADPDDPWSDITVPDNGAAGNNAPVDSDPNTGATAAAEDYVVVSGDNYWKIAQKVYKDGSKYKLIAEANPSVNANSLKIGTKLTIPALPNKSGPSDPVTGGDDSSAVGDGVYVVKSGDTLWTIAARELGNGSRFDEIEKLNPGIKGANLKIGQKLTLPAGSATSRPAASSDDSSTSRPARTTRRTGRTTGRVASDGGYTPHPGMKLGK